MIDFIFIIVVLVVGGVIGWKAREYLAMRFVANYQKMFEEAAMAETVNTVMIEVQRDGDQFFIYNKETGEFLAQGTNHADVSAILGERFPTKRFTATPQNLKDVGYKHDSI
jgi:hypothetical protein